MPQSSKKILSDLEKLNAKHCTYDHDMGDFESVIVGRNGPHALEFSVLWAFFSKLRFACNTGARLISYSGDGEQAEYWKPSIRLPDRAPRSYDRRVEWLEKQADAGWPNVDGYRLDTGTLYVTTRSTEVIGRLISLLDDVKEFPSRPETRYDAPRFSLRTSSPQAMSDMLQAIRRMHRKWLLPERSLADTLADLAPLELSDKDVVCGAVDRVTVTDHSVIIPLIPLNADTEQIVRSSAESLLSLVEDGLPYAKVRDWLSQFILPSAVKQLDKKYGVPASA